MLSKEKEKKAFIIGAGVGGLAAAIRLQMKGYQVTVFEKNSYPGGKLSDIKLDNYCFDAGPSLFTLPSLIEELFVLADEKVEDFFEYSRVPISCNYFFEDGTIVRAYAERDQFAKELKDKIGEPEVNLHAYLNRSALTYKHIGEIFLNHSLHKINTLFKAPIWKAIRHTKKAFLFKSMNKWNVQNFLTPKAVQIFNRYATYNGSNPFKAPAMLSLIPHLEHNIGTFYPKGGMISITKALYSLALKKGVVFSFETPVEKIIQHSNKVKGLVVNGTNHMADVVVSNMDVYFTYKHLLDDSLKATAILKQERSSSAYIFYWGISKSFPQLDLHNIFFTTDYEAEFKQLFKNGDAYHDPTVYINITSKMEKGKFAPEGKENWFVMVNTPANKGQNWEVIGLFYKEAIIKKLSKLLGEDIAPLIEVEKTLSPVNIESKTASYMGSLYGTSSNNNMAAFMRHPNFSKQIAGLYFVGGSVHPGGGIPLCLRSAKIMADIVLQGDKNMGH
jgi:phytoene desaturase